MAEDSIPFQKYWTASVSAESSKKFIVPPTTYILLSNVCISHLNPDSQFASTPVRLFASCSKHSKTNEDDGDNNNSSNENNSPVLICTLVPLKCEHISTNFRLMPDENVELTVKGPHLVDIIGYYPDPQREGDEEESNEGEFGEMSGEEEEEEEEEDSAESINTSDIEKEIKRRIEKDANC